VQDEGWTVLYSLTNKMQVVHQIAGTRVYLSLLPTYTSIIILTCIKHTGSILDNLNIM
jgi:hypothetical protein